MSQTQNEAVISELLAGCIVDLLADYGVDASPVVPPVSPSEMVSVVGFTSGEMRGNLAIAATYDFFESTNVISAQPTEEQVRDWAGELSNQLLGRIKNRLLAYDLVLAMGTPMVITGLRMDVGKRRTGIAERQAYLSSKGSIEAWFEATVESGFVLEKNESAVDLSQSEGDLLFF
jgi:chemotaxis protein CheX